MRRHWNKLALLLPALGVAMCVLLALSGGEPEPSYHGRKLSEWIKTLDFRGMGREETDALLHMGTNAFPLLVKWACYTPPKWRQSLQRFCDEHQRTIPRFVDDWAFKCDLRREHALRAFTRLRANAYPALPELNLAASQRHDQAKTNAAAWCIFLILKGLPPHVHPRFAG